MRPYLFTALFSILGGGDLRRGQAAMPRMRRPRYRRIYLRNRLGRPHLVSVRHLVVKENCHTVWMRLPDGNVVKRHNRKHFAVPA